jgi:hypothetical protein
MMTVKRIERAWNAKTYHRLFEDLTACRPEVVLESQSEQGWAIPAAAMAIIWLDEQSQAYAPVASMLIRHLISTQQPDGSWGDIPTTAVVLRALLCNHGDGIAIQRALGFLAATQRASGIWPAIPHYRLPDDPQASAMLLSQLGEHASFQAAVRIGDALGWFEQNAPALDRPTAEVWRRATRRCRVALAA